MKFTIIALAACGAVANATLTYNITQALQPGEFDKYHCLTTEGFAARLPACLQQCQRDAAKADGCAYDDYACHCVNYEPFSEVRPTPKLYMDGC